MAAKKGSHGKPGRKKATAGPARARAKPRVDAATRLVDAAVELAGERRWDEIGLADIAARAGLPLAELLARFPTKLDILAAFMRRIDRQVVDSLDAELAGEPARERLLDVLLARLEALAPHRAAVRSIARAAARAPDLALALNREALRSQRVMLAAAGISGEGAAGLARAEGLALVFARVLRVWLDDDDPGMARTMAELDRRLRDGERIMRGLGGVLSVLRLAREFVAAMAERRRESRGRRPASGTGETRP